MCICVARWLKWKPGHLCGAKALTNPHGRFKKINKKLNATQRNSGGQGPRPAAPPSQRHRALRRLPLAADQHGVPSHGVRARHARELRAAGMYVYMCVFGAGGRADRRKADR